jgi:hypothetical protein
VSICTYRRNRSSADVRMLSLYSLPPPCGRDNLVPEVLFRRQSRSTRFVLRCSVTPRLSQLPRESGSIEVRQGSSQRLQELHNVLLFLRLWFAQAVSGRLRRKGHRTHEYSREHDCKIESLPHRRNGRKETASIAHQRMDR